MADDGRRHILIHIKPDTHPGLGRLLIDRALRKAEAADLATTHVTVHHDEADQTLWSDADWLTRLRPAMPIAAAATEVKASSPVPAVAEPAPAAKANPPGVTPTPDTSVAVEEPSADAADKAPAAASPSPTPDPASPEAAPEADAA